MNDLISLGRQMDQQDPLREFRDSFHIPEQDGKPVIYFCGNSLGLQPRGARAALEQEMEDWSRYAINGFHQARNPWLNYAEGLAGLVSVLAGALPHEVTLMNGLGVNLHLMLLSLYRPDSKRFRILIEEGAFPTSRYATASQLRFHGLDPADSLIEVGPRTGEWLIRQQDLEETINRYRDSLALVLLGGVNYYSGQFFDLEAIARAAHQAGALAGFDLAHAIGNTPLHLHDWGVDFAVWCTYKYLNAGPGATGGAYLHERFALDEKLVRMAGWWGHEEKTRMAMERDFVPGTGAAGWQISTAQVLNMACLKASLEVFERTSIRQLRAKSLQLTAFLEQVIHEMGFPGLEIITPADPEWRGAQLSIYVGEEAEGVHQRLARAGVISDYRRPGVIRVAPVPLYNTFEEVARFGEILKSVLKNEIPG